jgi:hypothetical protein
MEERKREDINGSAQLSDLEKDVLDEYILDLKNIQAIIPLHEENSRAQYDRLSGEGASVRLLRNYRDYIVVNGELDKEQTINLDKMLTLV